jgi:hypothetical protein
MLEASVIGLGTMGSSLARLLFIGLELIVGWNTINFLTCSKCVPIYTGICKG